MKRMIFVLMAGFLFIASNIHAAGDLIVSGKIGVGTASPAVPVDITLRYGSVYIYETLGRPTLSLNSSVNGAAASLFQMVSTSTSDTILEGRSLDFRNYYLTTEGELVWVSGISSDLVSTGANQTDLSGQLRFVTRSAGNTTPFTRMTIKANGNVGIGTTNPDSLLHVADNSSDSHPELRIENDATNYALEVQGNVADRFRIASTFSTFGDNNPFIIELPNAAGVQNDALVIQTDGDVILGNSNGNVGIGTTNPQDKLHIKGHRIRLQDDVPEIFLLPNSVGDSVFTWGCHSTTCSGAAGGGLRFYSQKDYIGDVMYLHEDGNVGIGTMNPSYKLHVNGTIGTTNSGQVHSDYVFEPDYDLMSLEELESFIKERRHLPGIITDPEKAPNIDILSLNGKLLAKIEELTLYIIEQNKKISVLEEKVSKLENQSKK